MDSIFIGWLNSIAPGLGVALAVVLVLGGLLIKLSKNMTKAIKDHDEKIKEKVLESETDNDFKDNMLELAENVSKMQKSIERLDVQQTQHNEKINEKIDQLSTLIECVRDESRAGDLELMNKIKSNDERNAEINNTLETLAKNMNLMIRSDKEGIKAFITNEYYKSLDKKYIEVYILETLEARYNTYLQENGNTFVKGIMDEMRVMPHTPPKKPATRKSTKKTTTE